MNPSDKRFESLVDRVQSEPEAVRTESEELLCQPQWSLTDRSLLRWAHGLALRELGRLEPARSELRAAQAEAVSASQLVLAGRISVSLSIVEMSVGNTELAHELLDAAEPVLFAADLGVLVKQRGLLFHRAGDLAAAVAHYERALPLLEGGADQIAEVRLMLNLGLLHGQRGNPARGTELLERANSMARALDQHLLAAMAMHNLGYMEALCGRTPEALGWYESASEGFQSLGDTLHVALVGADRAALLLQAGLAREAHQEAARVREVVAGSGNLLDTAETDLVAARAALGTADIEAAIVSAGRAEASFRANGRDAWVPVAQMVAFLAASHRHPAAEVGLLARELERHGWSVEALHVRIAGAHNALADDRTDDALELLDSIAVPRHSVPVGDAIAEWTARAMRAIALDDRTAARRAVTSGLKLLRTNSLAVQALDLRAHAHDQAKYLADIGVRLAIQAGRPRELLARVELFANASIRRPGGVGAESTKLIADLAMLRVLDVERREAISRAEPTELIDKRRALTESAVRSHHRQIVGDSGSGEDLRIALRRLGDTTLVEYFLVDNRLWAITIVRGRSAMSELDVGPISDLIDQMSFALHRLARQHLSDRSIATAVEALDDVGAELGRVLIPSDVERASGPLLVVPAGVMHGISWRVLPALAKRSVAVASSLTAWSLAEQSRPERASASHAMLIAGPDLANASGEVNALAGVLDHATCMIDGDATIAACRHALSMSSVAHFACHGTFRSDNPMFSSLRLADGDLTIYDLEQCARLPHTIVMSACNAGQNAVLRGGALLGMASALIQLGVSSVIAPLTPVNDERSVALMVRLHTYLAAGLPAAEALAQASIGPDGELDPTAAPFICFGS